MKRLEGAFTLAEVLITLAIIGVIAAITMPTLSVNVQRQQVGPALAKAINTLENANRLALEEGNVRTLDQLSNDNSRYFETGLRNHIAWSESQIARPYTKFTNNSAFRMNGVNRMYVTKDGIAFMQVEGAPLSVGFVINPLNNRIEGANFNKYSNNYYTVYVDVNGNNKGPNKIGRDLFCLWVDTKGSVIPKGGREWAAYAQNAIDDMAQKEDGFFNVAVGEAQQRPANDCPTVDATTCAGMVVDNGYKVTYF